MQLPSSIRLLTAVLIGTVALFGAAAGAISLIILERQDALERASRYVVAFSAGQAVHELVRLNQRITAVGNPAVEMSTDEIALRFAILQNRLNLMQSGEFDHFVAEDPRRADDVAEVAAAVAAAEPLIPRVEEADANRRLLELLAPIEGTVVGLLAEANEYGGRRVAEDHQELLRLHWQFSALAVGLVVSGLLLIGLLVWNNRLLGRTRSHLVQALSDLAERKRALYAENAKFEAALSNLSQGLCMLDPGDNLIVANRRFRDLFGLGATEIEDETPIREVASRVPAEKVPSQGLTAIYAGEDGDPARTLELRDRTLLQVLETPLESGGRLLTYEDITERVRAQERIEYLARHDGLTGLPNRAALHEFLERSLYRLQRRGERFALLCLDLDRFKEINKSLGHGVGDQVLKQAADRVRASVRYEDLAARLGGDEFVLVQSGVLTADEAAALARRVINALAAPYRVDGQKIVVGATVGIAMAPDNGTDPEQLIQNAEVALYRAKANGRGTLHFFEENLQAHVQARWRIEVGLHEAAHDAEFEVLYQPQVRIATREIVGVEALLRWRSPRIGPVSPEEFVPIAEDTGLIVGLGEWVMRRACREAALWAAPIRLAVNVSPIQFRRGDLMETVTSALAESGLAAERLEIEITESLFVEEEERTSALMSELERLGVRFALDDFGTGYSSLSSVRRFPIAKIKIDQSFVRNLPANPGNLEIVRAITALAESLGLAITAEGVETREELELLRLVGCVDGQGYYFHRPMTADEMRMLLLAGGGSAGEAPLPVALRSAG